MLELQDYDFVLNHKPGKQMTKTDLLLRQASYERRENDNKNLVLFNNSLFTPDTIQEIQLKSKDVDFVTCI